MLDVTSAQKSFTLVFADQNERDTWASLFQKCSDELDRRRSQYVRSGTWRLESTAVWWNAVTHCSWQAWFVSMGACNTACTGCNDRLRLAACEGTSIRAERFNRTCSGAGQRVYSVMKSDAVWFELFHRSGYLSTLLMLYCCCRNRLHHLQLLLVPAQAQREL